jgi:hypothetical protein
MTSYKNDLSINFGQVGYARNGESFRVRLESSKLSELIEDTTKDHRVYELMLINRPGDVWDYVTVVIEAAPKRVAKAVADVREASRPPSSDEYPWSAHNVPFKVFDDIFFLDGDDTDPAAEAWRWQRNAPAMDAYAEQLLGFVRKAQSGAHWPRILRRHIIARTKSVGHPYDFLERKVAIAEGVKNKPRTPEHTTAFYKQLECSLQDPDMVSVAYQADGDYEVLRMLAEAQRWRANQSLHSPDHALFIQAIVNHPINNVAWDSMIHFYGSGPLQGDLFIQGIGLHRAPIKEMVGKPYPQSPWRRLLSVRDEGEIEGFCKTAGDGWFFYSDMKPLDRRLGLECIAWRRSRALGAVLSFEWGVTLFDHEKSLFIVGDSVDTPTREALAVLLADWEASSGDPVLVVIGDTRPFEALKCRRLFEVPTTLTSDEDKGKWLSELISMELPWSDAFIALDAPAWVAKELEIQSDRTAQILWRPWVVTNASNWVLNSSYVTQGNMAEVLHAAHLRAKSTRAKLI